MSYSINEATSESGKFQVGAAVIKEYTAVLDNFDGKYNGLKFEGADIQAVVALKLANEEWEYLDKGLYRIVQAKAIGETISVKAYDSMLFFDRPYSDSNLSYPASLQQIVHNACTDCQITYDGTGIQMTDFIVQKRPNDEALTYRDIISYAAQIMGCYAKISHLDRLEFSWYEKLPDFINAGTFFEHTDIVSGGTFTSIPEDIICAAFGSLGDNHHLYDLKTKSINTDNITITGVRVVPEVEKSDNQITVDYGQENYMIVIEQNPLIQDSVSAQSAATYVGQKLVGMTFRPLTVSVQSDPSIEAGDLVVISDDPRNNSVQSVITNTTFVMGGAQKIECTAETETEKTYTKYGAATKILAKAKQETQVELSAYEVAAQNMNQLAANTFGFYATTVKQSGGTVIAYRHNKPKLSESKIVYKSGIDGFFVTQDYRGSDAATTAAGKWSSGFDSSGNAVANILSVIGINFSWAHGGTLTLGGNGNGNGRLVILAASGAQIGYIDNTGVHFNQGVFSGSLQAATGTFAGSLQAATGTFRGDLSAAGGTFRGNLSAAGGTFSGDLQAASGTFKGAVAALGDRKSVRVSDGDIRFYYDYEGDIIFEDGTDPGQYVSIEATPSSTGGMGNLEIKAGNGAGNIKLNGLVRTDYIGTRNLEVSRNAAVDGKLSVQGRAELSYIYATNGIWCESDITAMGDLLATGDKSRIVETSFYGSRLLFCYETPTPMFGDIGFGKVDEQGVCYVLIDDIFSETIDSLTDYFVFLQKEGEGDLWVEKKERPYFVVRGTPGLSFSWEIKAVQKDSRALRLNDIALKYRVADTRDIDEIFDTEIEQYEEEITAVLDDALHFSLMRQKIELEVDLNEDFESFSGY